MVIIKCVQVLNGGKVRRFVKLTKTQKEANKFISDFNQDKFGIRESYCAQVKDFGSLTIEDFKNNSLETFNKVFALFRGKYVYLTKEDVGDMCRELVKEGEAIASDKLVKYIEEYMDELSDDLDLNLDEGDQ
jgi:hypothetical protein